MSQGLCLDASLSRAKNETNLGKVTYNQCGREVDCTFLYPKFSSFLKTLGSFIKAYNLFL